MAAIFFPAHVLDMGSLFLRLEEEIARMKKNQERRLHRKNAKIVKEGGTPMQLNRLRPDTTRRCGHCGKMGHMSARDISLPGSPPSLTGLICFFICARNQPQMSQMGRIQPPSWRTLRFSGEPDSHDT
jgi:hypothetical protein